MRESCPAREIRTPEAGLLVSIRSERPRQRREDRRLPRLRERIMALCSRLGLKPVELGAADTGEGPEGALAATTRFDRAQEGREAVTEGGG